MAVKEEAIPVNSVGDGAATSLRPEDKSPLLFGKKRKLLSFKQLVKHKRNASS